MGSVRRASAITVGLALALPACGFHATEAWTDALAPGGPCYEVNLADGLDAATTDELHGAFACLDGGGALAAFRPLDSAWDTPTRVDAAGLVFARWVNNLDTSDVSLAALVDSALGVASAPEEIEHALHLGLELAWGVPWTRLGDRTDLDRTEVLAATPLAGMSTLLASTATVLLDAPETRAPLADFLRSPALRQLAWTAAAIAEAPSGAGATLATAWPDDLADASERVRDPANDRWSEASGDSLRDLARWLLVRQRADGRTNLLALGAAAQPILTDPASVTSIRAALTAAVDRSTLEVAPTQLLHLVGVNARGGALLPGEDSALTSLLRLLRNGNTEVDCTVDLVLFDFDIHLGNLSVELLTLFATLDSDVAADRISLLGELLGVGLTEDMLDLIAESGVCPVIDTQFVADLHSVDRLVDPETTALLHVLLEVLGALEPQIPTLVDTLGTAVDAGLLPPIEEAIRDLAGAPLTAHVVGLIPALLDPTSAWSATEFPADTPPVTFETVWSWASFLLDPEGPVPTIQPLLTPLLSGADTWTLLAQVATLLGEPDAQARSLLAELPALLAEDPGLLVANDLAEGLENASQLDPLLVLVEGAGLRSALLQTTPDAPGPFPVVTSWVTGETFEQVLATLRALRALLAPEDNP